MGTEAEKAPAVGSDDPERSTSSVGPQNDLVMYTGKVDAAEYGTLKRELKSRHVQFIAIGGMIGTGLFLGTGVALQRAGPLSIFMAYTIVGTVVFAMVQSLGEITTWLPISGGLTVYAYRYADPAMGFAMGWNYAVSAAVVLCAEISAASVIIGYWDDTIHVGVWIAIILVVIAALNAFVVGGYGEAEFIFASFKVITIIGLLILAIIIDLGGGPDKDRRGFRYWKNPGAMKEYLVTGDAGRFCGFLKSFVNAVFAFLGAEVIAVCSCETKHPRKNIPKAVRRTFWRILFFYVFGVLAIGVLIPYDDPSLKAALENGAKGAAGSPWVVAIQNAGIKGLPHIINAVILSSAWSCGNSFAYAGSRNLYALAISGSAPKIFAKCTKRGIPIYAVGAIIAFGLLSFLNVGRSSTVVFGWFVNVTTISGLFNWFTLGVSYVRFRKGMEVQGISRDLMPFRGWFQPYAAWYTIIMSGSLILLTGFDVFFTGNFTVAGFFSSYSGVLLYLVPYVFHKLHYNEKQVSYHDMDFFTGKAEVDRDEREHVPPEPRNVWEKIWFAIA
ncbi:amino acid permease/ SLC12A domain-containing protein [Pyronema domesticum]|uniref:Similar to Proline-specific permease acc. no. P18696 n=1 Tax=Pyronema omphalodes (strain CBS 100304) TaxID=1076935 RepID=U4KUN8_PYROM|nr:amino acid permease/ SLC12A domain-containing protein [Pyronema domesticum]CCX05078.1 Similar to Proline-specific permease; acc. no. P18696 [Pyronema omphalodes CBS 100304]